MLWKDLTYMGYNKSLEETGGRSFALSVHSDNDKVRVFHHDYQMFLRCSHSVRVCGCKVDLIRIPFDGAILEDAVELPVVQSGS